MAIYQPTSEPPYYSWTPGQVELWDITTRSPVGPPGPGHMLSSTETMTLGLAFSPDGSRLVTGSGLNPDNNGDCTQGEVVLWDVAAFPKRIWDPERLRLGDPRPTDSPSAAVSELTFAPGCDGRLIAAGTIGGSILLIDAVSGKTTKELLGHQGPVMSLAFFPDKPGKGKETLTLASGSNDTGVRLWDVTDADQGAGHRPADDRPRRRRAGPGLRTHRREAAVGRERRGGDPLERDDPQPLVPRPGADGRTATGRRL